MRMVFLGDASVETGSGHIMRIFAIAEEAMAQNIDCILLGNLGGIDWLESKISTLGIDQIENREDYSTAPSENEILVIDSYTIAHNDPFICKRNWKAIVVIADRVTPEFPANLIIHPGLDGSWYKGNKNKFFFGPSYVPLRKSFQKLHCNPSQENVNKILVFSGGTDPFGLAQEMANILREIDSHREVVFISEKKYEIESLDKRFTVIPFGSNLETQLETTDLVITSASTSCLEMIAIKLPVGICCSIENQIELYSYLGNFDLAAQLGEREPTGMWKFDRDAIEKLIENNRFRLGLVQANQNFLDSFGSKRIIQAILSLAE